MPYVAEHLRVDATKLVDELRERTVEFENSGSLDKGIGELWPLLPIEARLICVLWATEKSDWNQHLWDQYEIE